MKTRFKPISKFKQKHIYGGYNWLPVAVATLPLILESLTHAVASFKIFQSTKGSVKYKGYQSTWDQKDSSKSAPNKVNSKIDNRINNYIYAY